MDSPNRTILMVPGWDQKPYCTEIGVNGNDILQRRTVFLGVSTAIASPIGGIAAKGDVTDQDLASCRH